MPEAIATRVITIDGVLRQIKAAGGLADFVQDGEQAFEIRFYAPEQIGAPDPTSGVHALSGLPFRKVRLENASDSPSDYGHVKITEIWGTQEDVARFDYNTDLKEWQMTQGDTGLSRYETKDITPGPGANESTITRRLRNEAGTVISTTQTINRRFAWGGAKVKEIREPDTLNLVTTYSYHETQGEPGYARVKDRVTPDGHWESYVYDSAGRIIETVSPWKDSTLSYPLTGPRRIVSQSFASLDAGDVVTSLDTRPRTITESVVTSTGAAPIVTSRTYYVYKIDSSGVYSEIVERAASSSSAFGAVGNLRSTRVHYTTLPTQAGYDPDSAGRLHYEEMRDGTRRFYTYTRTPATPSAYHTVTELHTTAAAPLGIDGLSTRLDSIYDFRGYLVERKSYLRSAGQWHLASTQTRTLNATGQLIASAENGRTNYAAVYDGPRLESETDERGVKVSYTYDALDKVESATREGVAASGTYDAQDSITILYLREFGGLDCGCDGEVTEITSAGSLSLETKTKKDPAGRLTYHKDAAGLETSFSYSLGGRQTNRINPDGGTVVDLTYLDRRPSSVTGTATIPVYYDYGVNSDGSVWTKMSYLSADGARWSKTTTNLLGQTIKQEQPAFDGGVTTTTYTYNAKGQNTRVRRSHFAGAVETLLIADTITEYDALGNVTRSGLDVNANGALDLASNDRITDVVRTFAQHESAWWQVVQSKTYAQLNSAAATQVSENRTRLSGFTGPLAAEIVDIDVDGNETRRRWDLDQANRLETLTETHPDSALSSVSLRRNGLVVSQSAKSVAAPTRFGYDALGRLVSVKDPRHAQTSTLTYHAATGQLLSQTDAAGHVTTIDYYLNGETGAGRVKLITNALSHTQRTGYDLFGRVVQQWGTASYPQAYSYSDHGELHTLRTWRDTGAANLDATTWPAPVGGDLTSWTYQSSTGLLTRKQYADTKGTDYTYDKAGRLSTRTWARGVATTYGYSSTSGELLSVDYSDSTPDVTSTYDRLGRPLTVTDATGLRSFGYLPATLRLDTETLPAAFFGSRVLKRDYQATASGEVPGRSAGYKLGTVADPDQDFAVSYAYDSTGRLSGITSPAGVFSYGYTANSDLIATLTSPVHAATRAYEANRNVLAVLENKVGSTVVSKFDYTVNAIGQRTERGQTGTAFASVSTDVFGYNSRGEVTSATNPSLPARDQGFAYDPIGNRQTFTTTSGTTSYTVNTLNQYTQVFAPFVPSVANPSFDFDGNQTTTGLGQAYVWDAENRLISVEPVIPSSGDKKVLNTYDGQSRRVRRQVFTHASGTWSPTSDEKFIYDGWNVVAVFDVSTFSASRLHTWGLDLSGAMQGAGGVGGLLAVKDGSAIYHYTYDANGNVSEVLDSMGGIAAHYEYTPFGDTYVSTGAYAATNEYRFSTKPLDPASGLYYYGFRYYNPSTGRWLSKDPIKEVEGEAAELLPEGPNVYAYVGNNSVNSIDPLGLNTSQYLTIVQRAGARMAELCLGAFKPKTEIGCDNCCGSAHALAAGALLAAYATRTAACGVNFFCHIREKAAFGLAAENLGKSNERCKADCYEKCGANK